MAWSIGNVEAASAESIKPEPKLFPILSRLCKLRETIRLQTDEDPAILAAAISLDAEFVAWADDLPLKYAYLTRTSGSGPNFLDKHHHVYDGVWVVSVWNTYRTARIMVNETIRRWLDKHTPSIPSIYKCKAEEATNVTRQMSTDICASVPFVLGDHLPQGTHYPKAAATFGLLWPLYITGMHTANPPSTRNWVVGRYERIGRELGIQQAHSLARILRLPKHIRMWDERQIGIVEEGDW